MKDGMAFPYRNPPGTPRENSAFRAKAPCAAIRLPFRKRRTQSPPQSASALPGRIPELDEVEKIP